MRFITGLIIYLKTASACWWLKSTKVEVRRYPLKKSSIKPQLKSAVRPTKPSPKKRKRLRGLPAPMPTDYVGEKPEWEEFKQKGNKCVSTTSAAVPCKDPIPAGGKCEDKYNWSNEGWIESKVECIKIPGGVKRREYRQECFFKDGEFQCWKHWSSTGCSITSCQSDKMDNNGMGFGKDKKAPRGGG